MFVSTEMKVGMTEAKNKHRAQLEQLLDEPLDQARRRAHETFDLLAGEQAKRIVIAGAGHLGRKLLHGLREEGVEPLAFSDNSEQLWGTEIMGLSVLAPRDAARLYGESAVFVLTIWRGEACESMSDRIEPYQRLGCKIVHFGYLFWKYPRQFLPHFSLDVPEKVLSAATDILRAFDLLIDERSQRIFLDHVHWRLHLQFERLPEPDRGPIYFRDELFELRADESFADCGAFDGDTLEQFIGRSRGLFEHAYCFEADPLNAKHLEERRALLAAEFRDRVSVFPHAVGARHETIRLDAQGSVSSAVCSEGGVEIQCLTLDQALAGKPVSLIKMDIEGYEADALVGAAGCIAELQPVLAICIYHRQEHLWSLPLLIASLGSGYSFFLRAHVYDGWDLVCYAIPKNRLRGLV